MRDRYANHRIPVNLWARLMRPQDEHDDAYCLALAKTIERMEIKRAEILNLTSNHEPLVRILFVRDDAPEADWGKWMGAKITTSNGHIWLARLAAFQPVTSELDFVARPDPVDREIARSATRSRLPPRISSISLRVSLPVGHFSRNFILLQ